MAAPYVEITCDLYILLIYKIFVFFALLVLTQISVAEEDPYLSAISIEAEKVESAEITTSDEAGKIETGDGPSLQAFEDDLKTRYMGSFTFYKKLPRRSREEVFEEYKAGASIDEIREKIMDRFLNQ